MSQALRLYTWEIESGKASSRVHRGPTLCLATAPTRVPFSHLYAASYEHEPCSAEQGHDPHHRAVFSAQECAQRRRWCNFTSPRSAVSTLAARWRPSTVLAPAAPPAGTRSALIVLPCSGASPCVCSAAPLTEPSGSCNRGSPPQGEPIVETRFNSKTLFRSSTRSTSRSTTILSVCRCQPPIPRGAHRKRLPHAWSRCAWTPSTPISRTRIAIKRQSMRI